VIKKTKKNELRPVHKEEYQLVEKDVSRRWKEDYQDFEFPVLVVLLYVREASLCYIVELELTISDSPTAMFLPSLRARFQCSSTRTVEISAGRPLKGKGRVCWGPLQTRRYT
jgi:hypothetical protein